MISFIIPYYNVPTEMLCECVESILALSLSPEEREIIIVDDGSERSPLELLRPLLDEVIYIRQRNGGLSNARNTGLRISRGEYIQFVDADDYLIRTPYEHCLDIMRYETPDLVVFNSTENPKGNMPLHFDGPMDGTSYLRHHSLRAAAWGYLFRRQILGQLRFREGIYHEDEEFTPQLLLRAERVFVTNADAYYYRRRKDSITQKRDIRTRVKRLKDLESVILRLNRLSHSGPLVDGEALQRRVSQLTMDYLYNVILQTRSVHQLEKSVARLRQAGLFPLPDKAYTQKYQWFRRLSSRPIGRMLLCRLLPHIAS